MGSSNAEVLPPTMTISRAMEIVAISPILLVAWQ